MWLCEPSLWLGRQKWSYWGTAAWLELKAGVHEEGPGAALQPANTAGGEEALGTAELSQGGAAGRDLCCCGPDQQLSAAPCCGMFKVGICQLV